MKKNNYILFILGFVSTTFSQEKIEGVQIDSTKITLKSFKNKSLEFYKNSKDFNYNVSKESNILEQLKDWLARILKRILSWFFDDINPAMGIIKSFLMILPYILLIILLYFIIKFFLKINTKTLMTVNTRTPSIHLTDEEELMKNTDLQDLVANAIQNKEYRLAVRYYYLLILKKLAEKELIIWQQEKTNEDYSKDLQGTELHKQFIESTRVYDFVWYGNFNISEVEFKKVAHLFTELKDEIDG